jgi:hypothetical protein
MRLYPIAFLLLASCAYNQKPIAKVESKDWSKVQIGMTEEEVVSVVGNPSLRETIPREDRIMTNEHGRMKPFSVNYFYYYDSLLKRSTHNSVEFYCKFNGGRVVRIDAPMPKETKFTVQGEYVKP